MCLQIQDEQAQRVEAELDRLILEQHITEQSLAGVTMLPGEPAKKSKKKCRYKSQYVIVTVVFIFVLFYVSCIYLVICQLHGCTSMALHGLLYAATL